MSLPRPEWLVLGLAVLVTATGCAPSSTPSGTVSAADCTAQVRANGTVYTAYALTHRAATRYAAADRADCHDTGTGPRGSVFAADPDRVTTWRFAGLPPDQVLGVRFDERSFAVYVADSVSAADRAAFVAAVAD